jgi:hypothetical protein
LPSCAIRPASCLASSRRNDVSVVIGLPLFSIFMSSSQRRGWKIGSALGGCALAALATLAWSASAQAAPYCIQSVGLPPQCLFGDVSQCRREALRVNGVCGLNPKEVLLPKTPAGRFCLVHNGPIVECIYVDRRTCDTESARRSAICVDSARPGTPDVDIFRQ